MGNTVKWQIPDSTEVTYDYTEVYRASSKTGTYSLLATQVISDNSYFDIDGGANHWYKIRFKYLADLKYSSYSKPILGGTAHGYCTVDDLRLLTGLTSTDISDSDLLQIQKYAVTELNGDVGRFWTGQYAEKVKYIDLEKQNRVNSSNTTYYVKELYIGDKNCDGLVDEDDLYVYSISASGVRTEYTVSTVDSELGQFVLSTAPTSGQILYVEYMSIPYMEDPAHMSIKLATSALVAAIASTKINPYNADSFRVGKISVSTSRGPFNKHMDRYHQYVQNIKRHVVRRGSCNDVELGDVTV